MRKALFFAVLLLVSLASCSDGTYYQVYEVQSPEVVKENKTLSYENADCRITYNLWSQGGNLNFLMQNKTDKNLYLVMTKSFYILNDMAYDYYSPSYYTYSVYNSASVTQTSGAAVGMKLSFLNKWFPMSLSRSNGTTATASQSKSVQTKEPEIICIPPHSSKFVKGFNISDHVYIDCENLAQNYPDSISETIRYNLDSSPLTFQNRLAYSFAEDGSDVCYINNKFWLASLRNYKDKSAIKKVEHVACETQNQYKAKEFVVAGPDRFYNQYKLSIDVNNYQIKKSKKEQKEKEK